jgi:hypothetical protein
MAGVAHGIPMTISIPNRGDPFVVYDFGIVRSGLVSIHIESRSGGTVDIAWDDRVDRHNNVTHYRSTPNCDRVVLRKGGGIWESFFDRGLRYIKLIFRGFEGELALKDVTVKETLTDYPLKSSAMFECDDRLLTDIWNASVNTIRNYMNGCGAGDPVRERCHWFGDDSLALRMAFYCYGDWTSWRRGLELTAQSQHTDGSFPVVSPGHFEDFNMVSGSCMWAIRVCEYYRHTGDTDFVKPLLQNINRHIEYELRFADGAGLLYETPGRRFLSWADGEPRTPYKKGEIWQKKELKRWGDFFDPPTCGYNAIINSYWLWCLRDCAGLAGELGNDELSGRYTRLYNTGINAFQSLFYDKTAGLYRDNVVYDSEGMKNEPTFCESTLFIMILASLIDSHKALSLYNTMTKDEFVCCRSSGGLEYSAVPIMLLKNGQTARALELYRDLWGTPVQNGATTCGEEFYRSEGNSDCHIHGAAPARDFLEHIAGIKIKAPFWNEVLIDPPENLHDMPCFKASVPTAYGNIEVVLIQEDGFKKYRYSVPDKCGCYCFSNGELVKADNAGDMIIGIR